MVQTKTRILGHYVERSIALGLALMIPAVGLLVAAGFVGGTGGTVMASIGSTLATVALLSFLYDPFLKDILAAEIIERVGLRDSIVRAGLRDIHNSRDLRLSDILGASRTLTVLPLDPLKWAADDFSDAMGIASRATLSLKVYLPSPDESPALQVTAERLGMSLSELEERLRSLPDELTRAWDDEPRHEDSQLEIFYYEGLPGTGLLVCEACVVVETGPTLGFQPTDRMTSVSVYEPDSVTAGWAASQLRRFPGDRDPTPAGLRPVTPPDELPGPPFPDAATDRTTSDG
jgi:hypothetical protein